MKNRFYHTSVLLLAAVLFPLSFLIAEDVDEDVRSDIFDMIIDAVSGNPDRGGEIAESLAMSFPEFAPGIAASAIRGLPEQTPGAVSSIVTAVGESVPGREEEIAAAAIEVAPDHADEIREVLGLESGSDPDGEWPEELHREVERARSLAELYPEQAGSLARRSVARVADEEAFWAVAVAEGVLEHAPEREEEVVRAAIAAAPHHEAEILDAFGVKPAAFEPEEIVEAEEPDEEDLPAEEVVEEPFTLDQVAEITELQNNEFFVRLDGRQIDVSRDRRAVHSFELRIFPERYFDPSEGRYLERHGAVITGDGIIGLVLKLVPADSKQREAFSRLLSDFQTKVDGAEEFLVETRRSEDPTLLLREYDDVLGAVYFHPSRKEVEARFHADFVDEIYTLSIGGAVTVTPETVRPLRHLIENLERYDRQFSEMLEVRERQMDMFRELTGRGLSAGEPEEDKDAEESL